jgi:DNA-directed RNA polymerase subunit alpha
VRRPSRRRAAVERIEQGFSEGFMTDPQAGTAGATMEPPAIDVWRFTRENEPALDLLFTIKDAVLAHRSLKGDLERGLDRLSEAEQPRDAGIARWMLAQYHRAHPLLKAAAGPAIEFLVAECCLRAEVVEGTPRPMRRPDVAATMLARHPLLARDPRVFAVYLEALLFDDDREGFLGALKTMPPSMKGTADAAYFEGRAGEMEGDREGACARYESALAKDASHRPSLFRLAYHEDLSGDDERAIELYERLAALKPADTHALLNLGVLYEDHDRYQDAVRCYQAVLDAFPNHRRARQYLRDAQGSLHMRVDDEHERRPERGNFMLRMPITEFELSVRARNCLAKMDIATLGDLVSRTENELLSYKNFGETTLQEIRSLLSSRGLSLGMKLDEHGLPVEEAPEEPIEVPVVESALGPVPIPDGINPATLNVVLADLELSLRCRRALAAIKANTIGDLLTHTEQELLALKNFGLTSLSELKAKLSEHGVNLKSS